MCVELLNKEAFKDRDMKTAGLEAVRMSNFASAWFLSLEQMVMI